MRCAVVAAAWLLAACQGETGVIAVSLATAPGSTLLDTAQTLRLTLTNPHQVTMAERTDGGFRLALELPASGEAGALVVEAFDASGTLVANGQSPLFPVGALTGRIVIYMAPPLSIAEAPRTLDPPRSELGTGILPYGVILVGGRLATGEPSDALGVYNAFDHSLVAGLPLPAPRAGTAVAISVGTAAFVFGGSDATGTPTANLWRFDTSVPPAGSYTDFGVKDGFARESEIAVPLGDERFVITGAPPAELFGIDGSLIASDDVAALPASGAAVTANDGFVTAIFAGPDGVVRIREGSASMLPVPAAARAGATTVALPGGKVAVVCGSTDGVRIDAASGTAEVFAGTPAIAKTGCASAATLRHLVIAGGTTASGIDGAVDVYDAATLAPLATLALVVPRTNAHAIALGNDQILIAGGVDATGAPVGTLELFTPPVE